MLVSAIVTNFNYGMFLGRCLRSLIDQTLPSDKYEIIVVDDASTDFSRTVIAAFEGDIIPVFNEKNLGIGASSNIGLRRARGRYVVRVDADDYVSRDFLHIAELYLSLNPQLCDAVAMDYYEIDEKEQILARRDARTHPIACGIVYRMDVLSQLGLYNDGLRIGEDAELRQRFIDGGYKLHHLALPLYRYKHHAQSMTSKLTS